MDFKFDGDEFSDDDLDELGAAGEGVGGEERAARKKKLAQLVQERCNKKLRGAGGAGVKRNHAK
jgi:hypothetical protein